MRRLIVGFVAGASEALVILVVVAAFVVGMYARGPVAGILAAAAAFVLCSLLFGALFVLLDIRDSLAASTKALGELLRTARQYAASSQPDSSGVSEQSGPSSARGTCPECGGTYAKSDYRPDALTIACPHCKAQIPRG